MPTTAIHGWVTPDGSEEPQVHLDLQSLADSIDADTPVALAGAPAHRIGRIWTETSTNRTFVSDGTNWNYLGGGTRDWSNEGAAGTTAISASTDTVVISAALGTVPAGRYLVLTQVVLNSGAGVAAGFVKIFANGVQFYQGRNDVDTTGRTVAHSDIYNHTGGALSLETRVNVGTASSSQGEGTVLRAILL